jgi:hypothetical protein
MIHANKIIVISSLAPRAVQAISNAITSHCSFSNVILLATSPSDSYISLKLGIFSKSTIKPLPQNTVIIKLFNLRCLLTALGAYLQNRGNVLISCEAKQAILDSLVRSQLSFRLFIVNKRLAFKIFSEYYRFRKTYSKILLRHFNIDFLFIYHRSYIIWYAFIEAAREIEIPVVVAEPNRAAFKVKNFPLATNNPISLSFKNIRHNNDYVNSPFDDFTLPWVQKSIVDEIGIRPRLNPDKLTYSERKIVLLAHLVSDTKYLLSNTFLYDTYFEWTIDTVKAYIKNQVDNPLIVRFHPSSCHPSHEWSFHLLLRHLKKIKHFKNYLNNRKIILDLPWATSLIKPMYSFNDIFITYQGTAVLDLAISGIKSISMNPLHMNNNITYVPSNARFYTSSVITNHFISSYSSELPKNFQMQARIIYCEYVKRTNTTPS